MRRGIRNIIKSIKVHRTSRCLSCSGNYLANTTHVLHSYSVVTNQYFILNVWFLLFIRSAPQHFNIIPCITRCAWNRTNCNGSTAHSVAAQLRAECTTRNAELFCNNDSSLLWPLSTPYNGIFRRSSRRSSLSWTLWKRPRRPKPPRLLT